MRTTHADKRNGNAVVRPRWERIVFAFAVAANLALLGLAVHNGISWILPGPPVAEDAHPIARELARRRVSNDDVQGFLVLLVLSLGSLVALWRMRRRIDPGPLVHMWSLVVVFVAPYFLGLGLMLGKLGLAVRLGSFEDLDTFDWRTGWLLAGFAAYVATLVGLRAWMAWRPSWWMVLLLLTPIVIVELAFIYASVMTFVETLIFGPPPPESAGFIAGMDYHHEIGDPSEWMIPIAIACWLTLFTAGALRRLVQIADEGERELQTNTPEPYEATITTDPN